MPSWGEFIASTQSAALQAILRHWHAARGASRLPSFEQLQLSSLSGPINRMWVYRCLTRVVTEPVIYRSAGTLTRQAGRSIEGERIALPLADDGLNIGGVLGVSDYRDPQLSGPFELITEKETWPSLR